MDTIKIGDIRYLNADELRNMTNPMAITCKGEPVAVLVPYKLFLEWQEAARGLTEDIRLETQ